MGLCGECNGYREARQSKKVSRLGKFEGRQNNICSHRPGFESGPGDDGVLAELGILRAVNVL